MELAEGHTSRPAVQRGLDKALAMQHEVVLQHIERLRKRNPDAKPEDIVRTLERQYLAAVTGTGAAVGAAAAAP